MPGVQCLPHSVEQGRFLSRLGHDTDATRAMWSAQRAPSVAPPAAGACSGASLLVHGLVGQVEDGVDGAAVPGPVGGEADRQRDWDLGRPEAHTSHLQLLMRITYPDFC